MKGAHYREGLTEDHMSDIEYYVGELKGLMEVCSHKDAILKAASDSLSRQLTCMQLKEATGFSHVVEEKMDLQDMIAHQSLVEPTSQTKKVDLDGYDFISDGEKIEAPNGRGSVATCSFGVPDDDLSMLG